MEWKTISATALGKSHEALGSPCQDFVAHSDVPVANIVIGVLADGAGSALHSEIGAQLAVTTSLNFLSANVINAIPTGEEQTKLLFESLVSAVRNHLKEYADKNQIRLRDLACTLIAFAASPCRLIAMQIGDGFVVARLDGNPNYEQLFTPEKGEYFNETAFVTENDALKSLKIYHHTGEIAFICLSSDGLEPVAIFRKDMQPSSQFFSALEKSFRESPDLKLGIRELKEWLESPNLSQRVDDDKSMLLCIRSTKESEQQCQVSEIESKAANEQQISDVPIGQEGDGTAS
jgi:hypothetical protein